MTEPTQQPDALIEAGWQALEAGDIEHAEDACEAALARSPQWIEALSLSAAVAMSRGDLDGAMATCKKAMEFAPADPRPYIQAAEVELYSANDEAALPLAVAAIDRAADEPDFVDAMLIKAACELGLERDDDSRRTLTELDSCTIDEPPLLYRLGELWLELESPERAKKLFSECIAREPESADAHHGLGLALEQLGEREPMLTSWRRVRELDRDARLPGWHLPASEFELIAREALSELPQAALDRIDNVPILIEEAPSDEQILAGTDPRLLGRFTGAASPDGTPKEAATVDAIYLYQHNLERAVGSQPELVEEIRVTVLHETAHFFGLEGDDLGLG